MISLRTSSQVRPSCQIDTDLLLLLFANTIITINTYMPYISFLLFPVLTYVSMNCMMRKKQNITTRSRKWSLNEHRSGTVD